MLSEKTWQQKSWYKDDEKNRNISICTLVSAGAIVYIHKCIRRKAVTESGLNMWRLSYIKKIEGAKWYEDIKRGCRRTDS